MRWVGGGPIRRDCPGQRLLFGEDDPWLVRWVGRCGRCGRELRTASSVERGLGPVCKRKWQGLEVDGLEIRGKIR